MFQFDLEYLLEYMLKISDTILSKNPLIKIKNMKQLNKFSKNYVSRISKFSDTILSKNPLIKII